MTIRIKNTLFMGSFLSIWIYTSPLLAWGERGHDIVARVAARVVAARLDQEPSGFGPLLVGRENMLGHLANVPDIVWRNQPELKDLNGPCHYVDFEYFIGPSTELAKLKLTDLPTTTSKISPAMYTRLKGVGKTSEPIKTRTAFLTAAGHAPFRVAELYRLMVEGLRSSAKKNADQDAGKAQEKGVNDALLAGGIMAHFVGDLTNPHHTTYDYDGWEKGQGGIHGYFEDGLVNAQPLGLDRDVFDEVMKQNPLQILRERNQIKKGAWLPVEASWALVIDSHSKLNELFDLDRKLSLIKPSQGGKSKDVAQRKPIDPKMASAYHSFIVSRLALAADALAELWIQAWEEAGSPSLKGYKSFNYPVKPDFIPLDYLVE